MLVDELQDTSRPQWRLVELLVQAWGEGAGVAHEGPVAPSIFVVGDRKQSIYGFRDADVGVLDEAARLIGRLRPGRTPDAPSCRASAHCRRCSSSSTTCATRSASSPTASTRFATAISTASPWTAANGAPSRWASWRRPTRDVRARRGGGDRAAPPRGETVRDRQTGVPRAIAPGDIAILFRSRDSHRDFERALDGVDVPFYVYKGLGFFDADEVKDVTALIQHLAEPDTHLHAAAFLRSRFVRLSDPALKALAPASPMRSRRRSCRRPSHGSGPTTTPR